MVANLTTSLIVILLIVFLASRAAQAGNEVKPGELHYLCGNKFTEVWATCCEVGYPACKNVQYTDNVEYLNKRGSPIMPSRVARSFLSKLTKRGFGQQSDTQTRATEECCHEGCTYKEVSEYRCI